MQCLVVTRVARFVVHYADYLPRVSAVGCVSYRSEFRFFLVQLGPILGNGISRNRE